MTLDDIIAIAVRGGDVLPSIGGRAVTSGGTPMTRFDPAIAAENPRRGISSALSAFDTQVSTRLFWRQRDLISNNIRTWPDGQVDNDSLGPEVRFQKKMYNGGVAYTRLWTQFDDTNAANARYANFWDSNVGVGYRQPLLKGSGTEFNAIAGSTDNQDFLLNNGIRIAQVDASISEFEFKKGLARYLGDIESAYWDLSLAYRIHDIRRAELDAANQELEFVRERIRSGRPSKDPLAESVAIEQVIVAETNLQECVFGSDRSPGIQYCERRLRQIAGLPIEDEWRLRPIENLSEARFVFDSNSVIEEALTKRPEVHQQRLRIKRREMELTASRNFALPQLDVVADYRLQGYGKYLIGEPPPLPVRQYPSSLGQLSQFENGEYQVALEFSMPIGFRQANSGIRYAELNLARERAILTELERQISFEVAAAIQEIDRVDRLAELHRKRLFNLDERMHVVDETVVIGKGTESDRYQVEQKRLEARIEYSRILVARASAIKNLVLIRGEIPSSGPNPNPPFIPMAAPTSNTAATASPTPAIRPSSSPDAKSATSNPNAIDQPRVDDSEQETTSEVHAARLPTPTKSNRPSFETARSLPYKSGSAYFKLPAPPR